MPEIDRDRFIPVYRPLIGARERRYVDECLKTGWISSRGRFVEEFEKSFAEFLGANHTIAVCNGTVALHLAMLALGIGRGDEVIVPTLTYVSSVNAVKYVDATPVFADSHPEYWGIDPARIEENITPKTKAIVTVHLYGHPCDMDPIMEIAKQHDLFVIEDAAEAHGAEYKGRRAGNFGKVNTFSFYGNKIITTGEGGMVVTDSDSLSKLCRRLRGQGVVAENTYWHDILGYNYRMSNVAAAIGLAQLERVNETLARKRTIAEVYIGELGSVDGVVLQAEAPWARNVYWMFSILVSQKQREPLRLYLAQEMVETRPFFSPVHMMPMYSEHENRNLPVAQDLAVRGINLPSGPTLTDAEVRRVCHLVRQYLTRR